MWFELVPNTCVCICFLASPLTVETHAHPMVLINVPEANIDTAVHVSKMVCRDIHHASTDTKGAGDVAPQSGVRSFQGTCCAINESAERAPEKQIKIIQYPSMYRKHVLDLPPIAGHKTHLTLVGSKSSEPQLYRQGSHRNVARSGQLARYAGVS